VVLLSRLVLTLNLMNQVDGKLIVVMLKFLEQNSVIEEKTLKKRGHDFHFQKLKNHGQSNFASYSRELFSSINIWNSFQCFNKNNKYGNILY
jgi:hypothetical protein